MIKINSELLEKSPVAKGKQELIDYADGKEISRKDAILAKCYDCMGYYVDGKVDCKLDNCPLYFYHPYRENKVTKKLEGEAKEKLLARFKKATVTAE